MKEPSADFVFFHSARRVVHAAGALARLDAIAKEFGCTRPALVIDGFFVGGEIEARAVAALKAGTGASPVVVPVPTHEPTTDTIAAAAEALAASDPDLIVAVGGGSAMDTAKVARLLLSNPGPVEAISGFGKPCGRIARCLCVHPPRRGRVRKCRNRRSRPRSVRK